MVPVADPIKGRVPDIHVSLKPGYTPSVEIERQVVVEIGPEVPPEEESTEGS